MPIVEPQSAVTRLRLCRRGYRPSPLFPVAMRRGSSGTPCPKFFDARQSSLCRLSFEAISFLFHLQVHAELHLGDLPYLLDIGPSLRLQLLDQGLRAIPHGVGSFLQGDRERGQFGVALGCLSCDLPVPRAHEFQNLSEETPRLCS